MTEVRGGSGYSGQQQSAGAGSGVVGGGGGVDGMVVVKTSWRLFGMKLFK